MAKRPKGKKKDKPASKNRHNAPRKGAGGAKAARKPRTRQPRQAALIEDARIGPLDKIASAIGDCRDNMNELRTEEKGHLQVARKLMHQYGKSVYKHAGVEIVLVPGDEKVRVRVLKDEGSSSSSGSDDAGDNNEAPDAGDSGDGEAAGEE